MGALRYDLTGQSFGRLTVIERAPRKTKSGIAHWKCSCSCGERSVVRSDHLRDGHTVSCGCLNRERLLAANTKYATPEERSVARREMRKAWKKPKPRSQRNRLRAAARDARQRYAASRALNMAVYGISDSTAPIDRGKLPPLCSCHHKPMRSNGMGGWRCGPSRREAERRQEQALKERDYERYREKVRRTERRRRAAARGVKSEPYTRQELYDRDGGRCRYCDELVGDDWHIAHLVALARGGADTLDNVAVACRSCNIADGVGRLPVQLHLPTAA